MTAKVKTPLEENVEGYLVRQIEARGGMALKGDIPGRRFIDRICIMPNKLTLYVECKRPKGGHRRPHQIETIKRLREMEHYACFVKSRDEVDALMRVFDDTWLDNARQI